MLYWDLNLYQSVLPSIHVWVTKEEFVILHIEFKWRVGVRFGQNVTKNNNSLKKNDSNKSCSEFNFLQKTQWTHVSIFLWSGARVLQRLLFLKYFNAQEWKRTFALRLKATKNTKDIKNASDENCSELNFLRTTHWMHLYFPWEWS